MKTIFYIIGIIFVVVFAIILYGNGVTNILSDLTKRKKKDPEN